MSYHVYTTEGIVLKRSNFGEADILLHVLTKDLGLIMASAKSARLSVSKLSGALQEYQNINISCIKGKNGWRATSVKDLGSFYFGLPVYTHKVLAKISSLLLQMIQGESPHPEIFAVVKESFEYLKNVDQKNIENFEVLSVLRILYKLGYVAIGDENKEFIENVSGWSEDLLEKVGKKKVPLVASINKAIKESHL